MQRASATSMAWWALLGWCKSVQVTCDSDGERCWPRHEQTRGGDCCNNKSERRRQASCAEAGSIHGRAGAILKGTTEKQTAIWLPAHGTADTNRGVEASGAVDASWKPCGAFGACGARNFAPTVAIGEPAALTAQTARPRETTSRRHYSLGRSKGAHTGSGVFTRGTAWQMEVRTF